VVPGAADPRAAGRREQWSPGSLRLHRADLGDGRHRGDRGLGHGRPVPHDPAGQRPVPAARHCAGLRAQPEPDGGSSPGAAAAGGVEDGRVAVRAGSAHRHGAAGLAVVARVQADAGVGLLGAPPDVRQVRPGLLPHPGGGRALAVHHDAAHGVRAAPESALQYRHGGAGSAFRGLRFADVRSVQRPVEQAGPARVPHRHLRCRRDRDLPRPWADAAEIAAEYPQDSCVVEIWPR
jgi:hypothetical protein